VTRLGRPSMRIGQYKSLELIPKAGDKQPVFEAAILGGTNPTIGVALVDTGAGFTLATEAFCKAHGLAIYGDVGTFKLANGGTAELIGTVSFQL
jgi:hypothetical protein